MSGPITVLRIERISDWQALVSGKQFIANLRCNRLVHDHASRGSATLSGRTHGAEKDRLHSHLEIGARRDDERVVAAEFHDRSAQAAVNRFCNVKTHGHRCR